MLSAAARCEPIINAYNGFSYDSSRPDGQQAQINEARMRMSIKSDNWIGSTLSPAFYINMMEHGWENRVAGTEDTFAHQDLYCVWMGL